MQVPIEQLANDRKERRLPLKITQRNASEVLTPSAMGRVNEGVETMKAEMRKLGAGMVLVIQADDLKAVRGAKLTVSKAAKQLDAKWQHWNVGPTVYARPAAEVRRRVGRPRKTVA